MIFVAKKKVVQIFPPSSFDKHPGLATLTGTMPDYRTDSPDKNTSFFGRLWKFRANINHTSSCL
jgi:hypothetical protein